MLSFASCNLQGLAAPCADPPRPLDFLVNGQLLRQSLQQLMLDSNISAVRPCFDSELGLTATSHLTHGRNPPASDLRGNSTSGSMCCTGCLYC